MASDFCAINYVKWDFIVYSSKWQCDGAGYLGINFI